MENDNVVYLKFPALTPEQRAYWHGQAAYWAVEEETATILLENAQRRRESALRMLGMLGYEGGLPDGA